MRLPEGKKPAVPPCRDEAFAITPLWWVKTSRGKAFVDYQNDCDRRRSAARGARGLYWHRTRQALHHDRHGDRSRQARQRRCQRYSRRGYRQIDRTGRHNDIPSILQPVALGTLCGTVRWPSFPASAQDPAARVGSRCSARFLSKSGFVDAILVVSAPWRGLAGKCDPRGAERPRARGHMRCSPLSARSTCRVSDAGIFLDRLYCNTFSALAAGRARYGLMLREDGIVFDDGTTSRLAEDHFMMTTTTAERRARHVAY